MCEGTMRPDKIKNWEPLGSKEGSSSRLIDYCCFQFRSKWSRSDSGWKYCETVGVIVFVLPHRISAFLF